MPLKHRRTPKEKKRLSLAKDRRNDYCENDKSSRKNIPRSKKLANRSVRRGDKQDLATDAEHAEGVLPLRLKKRWRKSPDSPLRVHIARQKRLRIERIGRSGKGHG